MRAGSRVLAAASAVMLVASAVVVSATPVGAADENTVVALFYDPVYVEICPGDDGCEGSNVREFLEAEGATLQLIEGITAADFSAGLAGADVLVVPELENSDQLGPDMAPDARMVVADFVAATGRAVFFGSTDPSDTINAIFGFSLVGGGQVCHTGAGDPGCVANESAVGTEFEGLGPLEYEDDTTGLDGATLPPGSISPFDDPDNPGLIPVGVMPYGDGSVVYNGFDWYLGGDPPPGVRGWADVLSQATTPYLVDIQAEVRGTGETLECPVSVGPGSQGTLIRWSGVFDDDGEVFDGEFVAGPNGEGSIQGFTNSPVQRTATVTLETPYFGQLGNDTCVLVFERAEPAPAPAPVAPIAAPVTAAQPTFTG